MFPDNLKLCKLIFKEVTQKLCNILNWNLNIWEIKGGATDWPVSPLVEQKEDDHFTGKHWEGSSVSHG